MNYGMLYSTVKHSKTQYSSLPEVRLVLQSCILHNLVKLCPSPVGLPAAEADDCGAAA